MKAGDLLARPLLLALCVSSCLAVACGGDDDDAGGPNGNAGEAGAPDKGGSSQGGSSGSNANGATAGKAGSKNGEAGEPTGGTTSTGGSTTNPGGGGAGGEPPATFVDFVHDLVENHTTDTDAPAQAVQSFSEEKDDHGHYLTPDGAFDDLF
ncbi:MAG TPA: hypothetical protein VEQ58_06765 [Polyangiaceae bacterium]|nr:hypothetical protein [Polyangiaceae bacterium]